jgi:phospholipase/carboxylesterase
MHRYSIVEQGAALESADKALILLHGRGGNAADILTLADQFCDDTFYIVAPEATGNSWYPYSFLSPEHTNEPWLTSAMDIVKRLIDNISTHVSTDKIFLMGFSQGACLSLETSARFPLRLAGIAAFSGGLIGDTVNPEKYNGNFRGTKIFIGSSDTDPHIPLGRVEESAGILSNLGADVMLRIYPGMGHTVSEEEVNEVRGFMF